MYTLDTVCDPNIMTLAQAVLEILFTSFHWVMIRKKGANSVMALQNLTKI